MPEDAPKADRSAAEGRPSQASPDKQPEEMRYDVAALQERSLGLLNTSPHVVAGALAGESKKTFTLEEAEKLCKDFLKRPDSTLEENE